jgi:hypothetical protein
MATPESIVFFDGFDHLPYFSTFSLFVHPKYPAYVIGSSGFGFYVDTGRSDPGRYAFDGHYADRSYLTYNSNLNFVLRDYPLRSASGRMSCGFWIMPTSSLGTPLQINTDFFSITGLDPSVGFLLNYLSLAIVKEGSITDRYYLEAWTHKTSGPSKYFLTSFSGDKLARSSELIFQSGQWVYCEILLTAAGAWEVRLDGTTILSGAAPHAPFYDRCGIKWNQGGFPAIKVDDLYMSDGSDAAFIGPTRVTTLFPRSDVANDGWTLSTLPSSGEGSGSIWQRINDAWNQTTLDEIIWSQLAGSSFLIKCGQAFPVGPIQAISLTHYSRVALPGAQRWRAIVRKDGESLDYLGSWQDIATSDWKFYRWQIARDPWTGLPWDEDDFTANAFSFGLEIESAVAKMEIRQLVIERLHLPSGGAGARYRAL